MDERGQIKLIDNEAALQVGTSLRDKAALCPSSLSLHCPASGCMLEVPGWLTEGPVTSYPLSPPAPLAL